MAIGSLKHCVPKGLIIDQNPIMPTSAGKVRYTSVADLRSSSNSVFTITDLMLIGTSIIWGVNFSAVKIALADFHPLIFNALRFGFASLVTLAMSASKRDLSLRREDVWRVFTLSLIGYVIYQLCFIYGMELTTPGNASLILATTPIFVVLLSLVLGVERVKRKIWGGIILSFFGILLITLGGNQTPTVANQTWIGDLLILAGTLCWSAYTVLSKPLLQKYSPVKLVTLTMIMGTPLLVLMSIPYLKEQSWTSISPNGWLCLIYSFLFSLVIGYIVWYNGISRIGSARTSLYQNLTPVIALTIAWLFLSEKITILQILGATLIFISLYLARHH
jgi:drug/metabolite transporter (DMT)-like permease